MGRRRFFVGPMVWFLFLILLGVFVILCYGIFSGLYDTSTIVWNVIILIFDFVWLLYILTNSNILVRDNEVIFPKQYKIDLKFFLGLGFIFAIFKKRDPIKISEIKSADLVVGFSKEKGVNSLHQPLIITLKDGRKETFMMKFFSKKSVIGLLRTLKEKNPKIHFSKSCKELIKLKSAFKLTKTEKEDWKSKSKLLFIILGILVLLILAIVYITNSGELKQETFSIDKIQMNTRGESSFTIYTTEGTFFTVSRDDRYKEQRQDFFDTLSSDQNLYENVIISYNSRLAGRFRNIVSVTLSNGEEFVIGRG